MVCLIPARGGSVRVPKKNIRVLNGHPLLAYTIAAARDAGLFDDGIFVSTDDADTADIARHYGASVINRPAHLATGRYPITDVDWMRHAFDMLPRRVYDWALLRPTSPFRTASTIIRAHRAWKDAATHSLRAVERVRQHPGKMWVRQAGSIVPLMPYAHDNGVAWHSSPTQSLPEVYVQNASLEMGLTHNIVTCNSLTGRSVAPFLTGGYEGFDINTEDDWQRAVHLLAARQATLPPVAVAARETDLWGV